MKARRPSGGNARLLALLLAALPGAASACDLESVPSLTAVSDFRSSVSRSSNSRSTTPAPGLAPAPRSAGSATQCDSADLDRLRMNDLQVIGTHNSYKQAMPPGEWAAHHTIDAEGADGLDYAHPPLAKQLDLGLRSLELDVYYDPKGSHYLKPPGAHRRGYRVPPWSADDLSRMAAPGFKVMHLHDIDFRSSCVTFVQCLTQVREWSRAHPRHVPIMVSVNAKDGRGGPGSVPALPFDAAAFDALDAEIRTVMAPADLLSPDQVRGEAAPLRDAVRSRGWPTLGEARGKVFFVLDEDARKTALYIEGHASLRGRAMFVNVAGGAAEAAFQVLNDPVADHERIARAVADGFLVRTRADADTREARRNDTARRDAAFTGAAQYISTDYPRPDPRWPGYRVVFPEGGYVRCNPARTSCHDPQDP
jgi:Phosphoinositide phospholipase C, Ca2+-dependent